MSVESASQREVPKRAKSTFEKVLGSEGQHEKFLGTEVEIKGRTYRIKKYLGGGFFANVWEARDEGEKRDVAVKISKPFNRELQFIAEQQKTNGERREAAESTRFFFREAAALKKLGTGEESPYPKFIDAQFAPHPTKKEIRVLVLIMEKIEGKALEEDTVDSGLHGDPAEMLSIARQLVEGVAFTHEKGFVHRDINPTNIMLDKDGRVRFIDLGLALFREPFPAQRAVYRQNDLVMDVGAYGFVPHGEKSPFSPERDIFSVGKVIDQMLFGEAAVTDERRRQADSRDLRDPHLIELGRLAKRMGAPNAQDRPKIQEIIQKITSLQTAS